MSLMTRLLLRGASDCLADAGRMAPWPSEKIADQQFDKIASELGLPTMLDAAPPPALALKIAQSLLAKSAELDAAGHGPTVYDVAFAKRASAMNFDERAALVTLEYMDKAAEDNASLTNAPDNTPAAGAMADRINKLDERNRPDGTYVLSARGTTTLPTGDVVGQEMPKTANSLSDALKYIQNSPRLRDALIGSGIGAGVGAVGGALSDEDHRVRNALIGAGGGAAVGGGVGWGQKELRNLLARREQSKALANPETTAVLNAPKQTPSGEKITDVRMMGHGSGPVRATGGAPVSVSEVPFGASDLVTHGQTGAAAAAAAHARDPVHMLVMSPHRAARHGGIQMSTATPDPMGSLRIGSAIELIDDYIKTAGYVPNVPALVALATLARYTDGVKHAAEVIGLSKTAEEADEKLEGLLDAAHDGDEDAVDPEVIAAVAEALHNGGEAEKSAALIEVLQYAARVEKTAGVGESAANALRKAKDAIVDAAKYVGRKASGGAKAVSEAVKSNPRAAAGIAGGTGLAAGGAGGYALGKRKEKKSSLAEIVDGLKAATELPKGEGAEGRVPELDMTNRPENAYLLARGDTATPPEGAGEVGQETEKDAAYFDALAKTASTWGGKLPATMTTAEKRAAVQRLHGLPPSERAAFVASLKR